MLQTVKILSAELDDAVPLLAFAGAPFTVASYLIEGRPSRTYEHTKRLMHTEPALWEALMHRLVQHATASIASQLDHGARAFQLFDSWAGSLSRADYDRFVLPYSSAVFGSLAASHPDAPGIHFGIGCDHLLESMHAAGSRVLGLDWRTPITRLDDAWAPPSWCRATSIPLVLAGTETAPTGPTRSGRQRRPQRPHLQPRSRCATRHGSRCARAVVDRVKERTAR